MKIWKLLFWVVAPFIIMYIGWLLNLCVMRANSNYMPVFSDACINGMILDTRHICGSSTTNLVGLSDWIQIGGMIYSPGDFLIFAFPYLMFLVEIWILQYIIVLVIRDRK